LAKLTIVYWRDIPAQIIATAGRKNVKRQLPSRFQEAIDRAAMRADAHASDAYLADWRRGDPGPCGDDIEAEAEAATRRIAAEYDDTRLDRLVTAGGREEN
jgi:hypothetical protein